MNTPYLKTSRWAREDQPVYKAMQKGILALSDAEILATFISDTKNTNGIDIARSILQKVNNNLIELSKLSVEELIKFDGIGYTTAVNIIAAFELGKRRRRSEIENRTQITKSYQCFEIFQQTLADQSYESFAAILLNRANRVIRVVLISTGGVTGTVVDPKKVFKLALDFNATSMILGHNHPSGQIQPSEADIALTRKMKNAGDMMDIYILDHIIVGDEQYYSFADDGRI